LEDVKGQNIALEGGDKGLKKNQEYLNRMVEGNVKSRINGKKEYQRFTNDIEWAYKHTNIVLNFSQSESFSITCLEAQFFGRHVIDSGGPAEIIESGQTRIIVPNRDVEAMASGMITLAEDNVLRDQIGLNGRQLVIKKFDVRSTTNRLREMYNEAIK
jgi:L-malate glycosyltransferase